MSIKEIDRREMVAHSYKFPWSIQGLLQITYETPTGPQAFYGSGTMVSPHYFMTAGHNLRLTDRTAVKLGIKKTSRPINIKFSLCSHENKTKYPSTIIGYAFHDEWGEKESQYYDYALVKLADPVGEKAGHASLKVLEEEAFFEAKVNVTGYPGDKVREYPQMYTMEGPIKAVTEHQIFYDVDTSPGQSGSGVWRREDKDIQVVGVHGYGGDLYNSGVRITYEVVEQVKEWIKRMPPEEDARA